MRKDKGETIKETRSKITQKAINDKREGTQKRTEKTQERKKKG